MEKITSIPLPTGKKPHHWFIAGDWHIDHLHKPSIEILKQMALDLPKSQRRLIINGDFLDAAFLMAKNLGHQKWISRADGMDEFFVPSAHEEYLLANEILDDLQKVFTEILFIEGNHDWRYRDFEKKAPCDYRHNFDYRANLGFTKRGISFVPYNSWVDIEGSDLSITHGMYHNNTTACKKHYEASGGRSVIFSHVHRFECRPFISRGHTRQVWSLPAMSELNPEYLKSIEQNWSNGFGQLIIRPDGIYNFHVYQIWNGILDTSHKRYEYHEKL